MVRERDGDASGRPWAAQLTARSIAQQRTAAIAHVLQML